jgi:hypothetical protein
MESGDGRQPPPLVYVSPPPDKPPTSLEEGCEMSKSGRRECKVRVTYGACHEPTRRLALQSKCAGEGSLCTPWALALGKLLIQTYQLGLALECFEARGPQCGGIPCVQSPDL